MRCAFENALRFENLESFTQRHPAYLEKVCDVRLDQSLTGLKGTGSYARYDGVSGLLGKAGGASHVENWPPVKHSLRFTVFLHRRANCIQIVKTEQRMSGRRTGKVCALRSQLGIGLACGPATSEGAEARPAMHPIPHAGGSREWRLEVWLPFDLADFATGPAIQQGR